MHPIMTVCFEIMDKAIDRKPNIEKRSQLMKYKSSIEMKRELLNQIKKPTLGCSALSFPLTFVVKGKANLHLSLMACIEQEQKTHYFLRTPIRIKQTRRQDVLQDETTSLSFSFFGFSTEIFTVKSG